MNEVFIKIKGLEIEDLFKDKDLVSIDDLISKLADLKCDVSHWEEKYNDLENQVQEYYVRRSDYDIYGVSENDFH